MNADEIIHALESEISIVEYIDGSYADGVDLQLLKNSLAIIKKQKCTIEHFKANKAIECKNCKFFVDDPNAKKFDLVAEGYDGLCVLKKWDDNNRQCMSTHNDDFCSLAEKR